MSSLKHITVRPPALHSDFTLSFDGHTVRVSSGDAVASEAHAGTSTSTLQLKFSQLESSPLMAYLMLDYLFGAYSTLTQAVIHNHLSLTSIERADFFKLPNLWHPRGLQTAALEETWTETQGRKHPVRPKLVPGVQYRRYIPEIDQTLSFRSADPERDLDTFHEWHNQPRVYDLWELNQSKEELKQYLIKGLADPHQIPLILELNEEPVGYFEVYWTAEDRLAPYYEYEAYDRGFHFLIGNKKFLGAKNTNAALRAISHFMFLDDPRTQKLLAEPRSNNQRVLRYVESLPGWTFVKEFDFPHKRAALLECPRALYFSENPL